MALLEIKDLTLGFGSDELVVDNVSIRIEAGEIHALIGESGSGKSLTALSVLRILPRNCRIIKGSILWNDGEVNTDILRLSLSELRMMRGGKIGTVFQDPMTALNPAMRCGEQVAESIRIHKRQGNSQIRKEVMELFEKVRLPDPQKIYKSYPHEISGGQRQRVMIAQAVSCSPKLLIADEPTTALDVTVQGRIIELINELRKRGNLAVLFISHDLSLVSDIADNISIMQGGKIVESGTARTIINNPGQPYTRGLLACRPPKDRKLERLPTVEEYLSGNKPILNKGTQKTENSDRSEVLLLVKNLSAFYKTSQNFLGKSKTEFQVLTDISFELYRTESLGLVGESGSGKTSLGRLLLNLIENRDGAIFYRNQNISGLSQREFRKFRKQIQFIFQDPYSSLNPKMNVLETLTEPMFVHKICKSKIECKAWAEKLVGDVGLHTGDLHKYPHEFSGGQRQRIAIARALSVKPEFIVCDEAVSALDVSVQAQILNLLKDLKEEFGLTFLFITHDMAVLRYFCDRVLVMKDGLIVESGEVEDVLNHPKHPFTKELMVN